MRDKVPLFYFYETSIGEMQYIDVSIEMHFSN